jgi:hypothetical protein
LRLHKALPENEKNNPYLDRDSILQRALARCYFKKGDYVRIKKHLPRGTIAKVADIQTDKAKIDWGPNGCTPNCVKLEIPIVDKGTKQVKGHHEMWITPRRCALERLGTGA